MIKLEIRRLNCHYSSGSGMNFPKNWGDVNFEFGCSRIENQVQIIIFLAHACSSYLLGYWKSTCP